MTVQEADVRRGFGGGTTTGVRSDGRGERRDGTTEARDENHEAAFVAVVPTDRIGGAERTLQTLVREAAREFRRGHVIVLSRGRTGGWDDLPAHVRMHYVDADRELWGAPKTLRRLWKISRTERITLTLSSHVHCNALLGAARRLGWLPEACQIFREPTITRLHYSGWERVGVRQYYRFYPAQAFVVCQTELMRTNLLAFVPRAAGWQLVVVPNPVDAEALRRKAQANGLPREFTATPYAVVLGRLIPEKGHDVLLRAFVEFRREMPSWRLVVVGSGPRETPIRSLANHLGLTEAVVFIGRQDNPYPYLAGSALGVVSSHLEGFPNVLLEKMALCPRVVSTICAGGVQELPGIFTCPSEDAKALTTAMLRAVRESGPVHVTAMRAEVARRTPTSYWMAIKQAGLTRGPRSADGSQRQA